MGKGREQENASYTGARELQVGILIARQKALGDFYFLLKFSQNR